MTRGYLKIRDPHPMFPSKVYYFVPHYIYCIHWFDGYTIYIYTHVLKSKRCDYMQFMILGPNAGRQHVRCANYHSCQVQIHVPNRLGIIG